MSIILSNFSTPLSILTNVNYKFASNLPFSKWEVIFKDSMTMAAAIDRLVHRSVVLEMNVANYRAEQARKRKNKDK